MLIFLLLPLYLVRVGALSGSVGDAGGRKTWRVVERRIGSTTTPQHPGSPPFARAADSTGGWQQTTRRGAHLDPSVPTAAVLASGIYNTTASAIRAQFP